MDSLHECLDQLGGGPLDVVVHVYPSEPEIADRYAALGARRVVFVCGDPQELPALRALQPGRPWLEIVQAALAPDEGSTVWLRCNLAALSGLLEPAGLQEYYPRLQVTERVPVQGVTLATQLTKLGCAEVDADEWGGPRLLVLETPGLEGLLLQGLAADMLRTFGWVLLRGSQAGLYDGGESYDWAVEWLQARCYRPIHADHEKATLWPATLLCFDESAAERERLQERLTALQAELSGARAEADRYRLEHAGEAERLGGERDAHVRRVAELEAMLARADTQAEQARQQAEQLTRQRDALAAERTLKLDELGQLLKQRDALIAQLKSELQASTQARAALEARLTELGVRQRMVDEEMFRAEGQLALIRDVLLREPGL